MVGIGRALGIVYVFSCNFRTPASVLPNCPVVAPYLSPKGIFNKNFVPKEYGYASVTM